MIHGISQFAGRWLDWAVAVSWQLALLVCLIGVLTFVLRGASPRLRYALWLLVLVKTFLPPTEDRGDSSRIFAAASAVGPTKLAPTLTVATPRSPTWLASA